MERYDTDLWAFLKSNNEISFDLSERIQMAKRFLQKVEEIKYHNVQHGDLKPSNVLINLTPEGKWNGKMEITDYGISQFQFGGFVRHHSAGTSGWSTSIEFRSKFASGKSLDYFAPRLLVYMILLSWNRAWSYIWDGISTSTPENEVECLFSHANNDFSIENLLKEIEARIGQESFCEKWAAYCKSSTSNFVVNSNTQRSLDVEQEFSNMNLNLQDFVTDGTIVHDQKLTDLCHSFSIISSLRKELLNNMAGRKTKGEGFHRVNKMEAFEALDIRRPGWPCSFSNMLADFVMEVSPRGRHKRYKFRVPSTGMRNRGVVPGGSGYRIGD